MRQVISVIMDDKPTLALRRKIWVALSGLLDAWGLSGEKAGELKALLQVTGR